MVLLLQKKRKVAEYLRRLYYICSISQHVNHYLNKETIIYMEIKLLRLRSNSKSNRDAFRRGPLNTNDATLPHRKYETIVYRVIKKDGLNWRVNGASTHARQLVAVFQVLCSLYGLICVGYAENSWICLTFSSDTRGRSERLPLHRQPICSNLWFQRQMLLLVGGWTLKRRRNARCTAVADSVLMNSRTHKIVCCVVAILLSTDAAARLYARRAV